MGAKNRAAALMQRRTHPFPCDENRQKHADGEWSGMGRDLCKASIMRE